jgi:hypothetical protein
MTKSHSYNHHWMRRKLTIKGKTVFHRQCLVCGRDFIIDCPAEGWRAVHVGLLDFDFLDEETNRRWIFEDCPGRQLPEEANDRRVRHLNGPGEITHSLKRTLV